VNFRLPSGLQVVLESNHAAPVVAFQAWIKAGSADEDPRSAGVAHFLEHMLFKGTIKRGVGRIAQEIEGAGGEINAWTSYDETTYHLVLASNYFDAGLDILSDAILRSTFDPDELASERAVVIEEIKQGLDDPDRLATQGLLSAAFGAHPYGRPIIGEMETVTRISRDELVGFFRQNYVGNRMTLVVVGDVDESRARAAIEEAFAELPAGSLPDGRPTGEPLVSAHWPRVRVTSRDVKESQLLFGFNIPEVTHPDIPALDLLSVLLGQGETSRLYRELVRNRPLASGASAYTFVGRDPGLFVVAAGLQAPRLESAAAALLGEVQRLAAEPIAADEIAKCRTMVESERVFDKETVQGYARKLGFFASIVGDLGFEERYFDRLRHLSGADLQDVARRYLDLDRIAVFAQVPPGKGPRSSERLEEKLAGIVKRAHSSRKVGIRNRRPSGEVVSHRYRSGLRLLVLPDPTVPIVAARAAWMGGLRYEDPGTNGVSNLIAALLTRGTTSRSAEQIMGAVEGMAGSLSGYSGRNSLGLAAEFLTRYWGQGLEILADCLQNPTFPENEIVRERRLILDDIKAQEDNLTHVVFQAFHRALWSRHPYRLDPLGSKASLEGFSARQVRAFFRRHYTPAGLTLAVVGDVDPDEVIEQVSRLFPNQKGVSPQRKKVPAERGVAGPRLAECLLPREQAHIVLGYPGVALNHPDRFALETLAQILSGQGGRLFVEVRERRGLAYRVSAFSLEGLDPGYFAIYVGTSPQKVDEVLGAVRAEIAGILSQGVELAELERAQRYLVGSHAIGLQRKSAIAAALALHEAYGQGWQAYREYGNQIGQVGVADISRVAHKYFRPSREVLAVLRPPARRSVAKRRRT